MPDLICSFEHELLVKAIRRAAVGARGEAGPVGIEGDYPVRRMLSLARLCLPHLRDAATRSGVFLENAGRLMIDTGNHLEYSAPECANPWDAVRYAAAADRIIADLAARLARSCSEIEDVIVSKVNVDYSGCGATWGAHESYSHRVAPRLLRQWLLPHLASRLIYTGAGGFDSLAPGIEFLVSPRVRHLSSDVSDSSTHDRGLYHTRNEPLGETSWNRLHCLAGEANSSHTSMLLKLGCTALVTASIDHGGRPPEAVILGSPLRAAQAFSRDPCCELRVEAGRRLSAAAIQRHYLAVARQTAANGLLPGWAGELCDLWEDVLDRHESAPQSLTGVLDWRIKRTLYDDHAEQAGFPAAELARWNKAVTAIYREMRLDDTDHFTAMRQLADLDFTVSTQAASGRVRDLLAREGPEAERLPDFLRLRQELFEMDIRYGQLGPQGLFDVLDREGVLDHRVAGCDDEAIERARTEPPLDTRAKIRGDCVRQFACQSGRYRCDWQYVIDGQTRRLLDLADPFCAGAEWAPMPSRPRP